MAAVGSSYRFALRGNVVAVVVEGYLDLGAKARVIGQDTAGAHWLLEVDAEGHLINVVAGPITADTALAMSEAVLTGKDHGPVALVVTALALAVAARAVKDAA